MLLSASILGISSLLLYRDRIPLKLSYLDIVFGISTATILYLTFYAGDIVLEYLGLAASVGDVYRMISSAADLAIVSIALIWIGAMEELYFSR
jgi:hypothetical protein